MPMLPIQEPGDSTLYNALMIAAKHGQSEAVMMLLAAGFDVNHKDLLVGIMHIPMVVPDLDDPSLHCAARRTQTHH
jgi:ankyrin repeat protein